MPDWDLAHAQTSNREPINPRPLDQTAIYRALDEHAIGFITYSEGCNDDVNKIVWSELGWDRNADPLETLRQYSRYFIGDRYTDSFAQGLLALERNWRGPLAGNAGVDTTLQQFQAMERAAAPRDLLNWRFQQALYRAYYDAYVRQRLLDEQALEADAMAASRAHVRAGALAALDAAEAALARATTVQAAAPLRARVGELAEALFQSIRMQLAVKPYQRDCRRPRRDARHHRHAAQRSRLAGRALQGDPRARQGGGAAGGNRRDPALDRPGARRLLRRPRRPLPSAAPVRGPGLPTDPGSFKSTATGFGYRPGWRLSWMTHAESFYDGRVEMRYDGLDPLRATASASSTPATSTASRGSCASTPTARTRCTAGSPSRAIRSRWSSTCRRRRRPTAR